MKKILSVVASVAMLASLSAGMFASAEGESATPNKVLALGVTYSPNAEHSNEGFLFPGITPFDEKNGNFGLNYTLEEGDVLEYDVKVVTKAAGIYMGNLDFYMDKAAPDSTERQLKAFGDALKGEDDSVNMDKSTDITPFADNKWYNRKIDLTSAKGYKLYQLQIMAYAPVNSNAADGATALCYYDNIKITNNGVIKKVVFTGENADETIDLSNYTVGNWSLGGAASVKLVEDEVKYPTTDTTTDTTTGDTTTSAPVIEKKTIDYIQLDVNTKKSAANHSNYRLGAMSTPEGVYKIAEGDYVEYKVKLLNRVKGIGGVDFNVVFKDQADADKGTLEAQTNQLLSKMKTEYTGRNVDFSAEKYGEWTTVKAPLVFTGAYIDTAFVSNNVEVGAMDGTATVLYDDIVIKGADGTEKFVIFKDYENRINNQDIIMRCEKASEEASDCQLTWVRTMYVDKNGTSEMTFAEKDAMKNTTITYTGNNDVKHGKLTVSGNKATYVADKDYVGMDYGTITVKYDVSSFSDADKATFINTPKLKLNIAVAVDPEKVDPDSGNDKPTTGDTLPLIAMAMLLPASLVAIVAVKKSKKK